LPLRGGSKESMARGTGARWKSPHTIRCRRTRNTRRIWWNPSTFERRLAMSENVFPLPIIPCPSCGANILDAGFHNTCTENVRVREDNFTYTKHGRLYLEYKQGDETVDHESDLEAY